MRFDRNAPCSSNCWVGLLASASHQTEPADVLATLPRRPFLAIAHRWLSSCLSSSWRAVGAQAGEDPRRGKLGQWEMLDAAIRILSVDERQTLVWLPKARLSSEATMRTAGQLQVIEPYTIRYILDGILLLIGRLSRRELFWFRTCLWTGDRCQYKIACMQRFCLKCLSAYNACRRFKWATKINKRAIKEPCPFYSFRRPSGWRLGLRNLGKNGLAWRPSVPWASRLGPSPVVPFPFALSVHDEWGSREGKRLAADVWWFPLSGECDRGKQLLPATVYLSIRGPCSLNFFSSTRLLLLLLRGPLGKGRRRSLVAGVLPQQNRTPLW